MDITDSFAFPKLSVNPGRQVGELTGEEVEILGWSLAEALSDECCTACQEEPLTCRQGEEESGDGDLEARQRGDVVIVCLWWTLGATVQRGCDDRRPGFTDVLWED